MKWFLRFVVWATLLAVPCWLAFPFYQRGLAAAVSLTLTSLGQPIRLARVDVAAPFDLGIFAALCLASRRAPARARARALAIGLPALAIVEVVTVSAAITIIRSSTTPEGPSPDALRAGFYLADTIPWASAALVWLLLLGPWELPLARAAAQMTRRGT